MIRKVLSSLFKPTQSLQSVLNRQNFSQTSKSSKNETSKPSQSNPKEQQKVVNQTKSQQKQQQKENQQEFSYQKQDRNTVGWWIYRTFFWGTTFTIGYNVYLVANHNKKTPVEDQTFAVPYVIDLAKMLVNSYHQNMRFFAEPPVKKFLPDSIHPSMQLKTLVLNMSGTLLRTDFIFGKGRTMKRRPGLNQLLKRLSQKYEIIIFSNDDFMFLTTAVQHLDPRQQTFMGVFGHESMTWSQGQYIKDLTYLNRDLRNVVVIDSDIQNVSKQPQNVIVLDDFEGDDKDDQLIKLLPLLQSLSDPSVRDVRKVLANLGDRPHEKYYQKYMEKKKKVQKHSTGGILGGFFGGSKAKGQGLN